MKIQHLRFFVAVVEHGGVQRAAEALRVSQPAVSAGLRTLEDELGQKLFERTSIGRRLRLHPHAERFHRRVLAILRDCDAARTEFTSGAGERRRVRLGILPTLSEGDVAAVTVAIRRDHPDWSLELWEGAVDRLAGWLRQGRIDAAWTLVADAGPKTAALWSEPFVALVPHDHPAAQRDSPSLTIGELGELPFVLRSGCEMGGEARGKLRAAGVELKIVARVEREEVAARLISLGLGATIAPRSLERPNVAAIPLIGLHLVRSIGVRWGDDTDPDIREGLLDALSRARRPIEVAADAAVEHA
jgi:DNA-binding transcriptional LysR family regulator